MDGNQPYISSGTWSLLGVKTPKPITDKASRAANYSNEGGVGYNRYQKNIMGMWLVNGLQKELCSGLGFAEIVNAAKESACDALLSETISAVPTAALRKAMRKPLRSWSETRCAPMKSCTLWAAVRKMTF